MKKKMDKIFRSHLVKEYSQAKRDRTETLWMRLVKERKSCPSKQEMERELEGKEGTIVIGR